MTTQESPPCPSSSGSAIGSQTACLTGSNGCSESAEPYDEMSAFCAHLSARALSEALQRHHTLNSYGQKAGAAHYLEDAMREFDELTDLMATLKAGTTIERRIARIVADDQAARVQS